MSTAVEDLKRNPDENKHLWDQFIRLGERIGDGDLDAAEARWMNAEYKKLSCILVPEIAEHYKEVRRNKARSIDAQLQKLLEVKTCDCGSKLRQARAGSKICYCIACNKRFMASKKK